MSGPSPAQVASAAGDPDEPAPTDRSVIDVFVRGCPSRRTLENVAGRWGILAMAALSGGTYRFNALRRRVDGVSEKMLAQTLQSLERDGLVRREVRTMIPPRVEYSLTGLGAEVAVKLVGLIDLVERSMDEIRGAQSRYDRGV
jgi:DNA-binding HxlR family transcriptional regulator